MQAVKQSHSSTLQKWLGAGPSVGLHTHTVANSDTCLNGFPNSRHLVNQDFTTSAYPFQPTLWKFNPAEAASPPYISMKYQHDSPHGLPQDQQHSFSHVTVQPFARGNSTNVQAHPNQRNIPPPFNANFQEWLMEQASLQDLKRYTSVDERYQN